MPPSLRRAAAVLGISDATAAEVRRLYPEVGELAFKVFEKNVARTYKMEIVERIHVVDVRDKADIKKKTDRLEAIFTLGQRLGASEGQDGCCAD